MSGGRGWLWDVVREHSEGDGGVLRCVLRPDGDALGVVCACGAQLALGVYPRHRDDAAWIGAARDAARRAGWSDATCPACAGRAWRQLALPGVRRG